MNINRPKLLSPVGSFESLTSAINAGCDAIYFGVEQLNMRTKSVPAITIEDIKHVVSQCHESGVQAYLTLNTVVYDYDMQLARRIVQTCKEEGVDAIIASDFAVFQLCREFNMPLHISTQSNVSNIQSVEFFASMADVVVLARELTLKQVESITREIGRRQIRGVSGELMKIECFVHGALCMAVSGKCYLSLHEKNASANRGACVQNCRRPYKVTDLETGNELLIDNEYIMSPKDLCTIDFVDELINVGIDVFKIEGRSKSADYVYTTTKCYREAIDAVVQGIYTREKINAWREKLEKVYNRGFWEGYYLGKRLGEWTPDPGSVASEKKIYMAKFNRYYPKIKVAEFEVQTGKLNRGDEIMIIGKKNGVDKLQINEFYVNGVPAVTAEKGDKITFSFHTELSPNDKLYKVVNADG